MTKHFNKSSEKDKRRNLRKKSTLSEELVWRFLRNRQLLDVKFKRQYSVDKFVIDFYSPELKLAVELDGASHNEPGKKGYDRMRSRYLEKYGITVIRIKDEELFGNPNKAFGKIEGEIIRLRKNIK